MTEAVAVISSEDVAHTRRWLTQFARDWVGETPIRIHKREYDGLGPSFSDEFIGYIGELLCSVPTCVICLERRKQPKQMIASEDYKRLHRSQSRTRTTKAFRKLRKIAPLEFDVLRMIVMHGLSLEQVAQRLTDRAASRGLDETYDVRDVTILAVSGTGKLSDWY